MSLPRIDDCKNRKGVFQEVSGKFVFALPVFLSLL